MSSEIPDAYLTSETSLCALRSLTTSLKRTSSSMLYDIMSSNNIHGPCGTANMIAHAWKVMDRIVTIPRTIWKSLHRATLITSNNIHGPCGAANMIAHAWKAMDKIVPVLRTIPKPLHQATISSENSFSEYRHTSPERGGFTHDLKMRNNNVHCIDNQPVGGHLQELTSMTRWSMLWKP